MHLQWRAGQVSWGLCSAMSNCQRRAEQGGRRRGRRRMRTIVSPKPSKPSRLDNDEGMLLSQPSHSSTDAPTLSRFERLSFLRSLLAIGHLLPSYSRVVTRVTSLSPMTPLSNTVLRNSGSWVVPDSEPEREQRRKEERRKRRKERRISSAMSDDSFSGKVANKVSYHRRTE